MKYIKMLLIGACLLPTLAFAYYEADGQPHYFNNGGSIDFKVDQFYLQLDKKTQAVKCHIQVLNKILPYSNNTVDVFLDTTSYNPGPDADRTGERIISQQGYYYFYQGGSRRLTGRGEKYSYFHFQFSPTQENPSPQVKITCNLPGR